MTISPALTCDVCAQDLSGVPCIDHERRTKIDIVFEKVIDHVDAEIKRCPTCDNTVKGVFPPDMHGPLPYGDGLKAFVIRLADQSDGGPEPGTEVSEIDDRRRDC